MKFQDPSFKIFLNGPTDGQGETNMLPSFLKLWAKLYVTKLWRRDIFNCISVIGRILGSIPFVAVTYITTKNKEILTEILTCILSIPNPDTFSNSGEPLRLN